MPSTESPGRKTIAHKPKVTRSRTGCRNCRASKVKCDEDKPSCARCIRLKTDCDYKPKPRKKYTRRARGNSITASDTIPSTDRDGWNVLAASVIPPADVNSSWSRSPLSANFHHPGLTFPESSRTEESSEATSTPSTSAPVQTYTYTTQPRQLPDALSEYDPSLIDWPEGESGYILTPDDHIAIVYYYHIFPASEENKVPEHGGPAVVWRLASQDAMVMHTICALAGRTLCERIRLCAEEERLRRAGALNHYNAALRMLHAALRDQEAPSGPALDGVLATLWLMIKYEQFFGDGSPERLEAHLMGAATILKSRVPEMRSMLRADQGLDSLELEEEHGTTITQNSSVSSLSYRLISWIATVDGGAAINGFGGVFNRVLGELLFEQDDSTVQRLRAFHLFYKLSDLVNHGLWSSSYPQDQLVEDLEASAVLVLETEVAQLRYMLSGVHAAKESSPRRKALLTDISRGLRDVEARYHAPINTARFLNLSELSSCSQKRFVIALRFIVAFYRAVELCFLRCLWGAQPLKQRQRLALGEIMALAARAHVDQGEDITKRFAWSMFVAALETDDIVHRDWVMSRYDAAAAREGGHLRLARDALRVCFAAQKSGERTMNYAELMARRDVDKFSI